MIALPRLARADESRRVLRRCLANRATSPEAAESLVQVALAQSRLIPGQLIWPWVVYDGANLLTGCTTIESAGGSALLLLPEGFRTHLGHDTAVVAVRHVLDYQRSRGTRWMSALQETAGTPEDAVLVDAGFLRLTRLLYLHLPMHERVARLDADTTWRWSIYGEDTHAQFIRVIADSYAASLDCAELSAWRSPGEALDCHKHSGLFDARRWLLAADELGPAGCILLNEVPLRDGLEVAYMGVAPRARGTGLGLALLSRAKWIARRSGFAALCLVVDERNAPARGLYQRVGFRGDIERHAWIALLFDRT